MVSITFDTTLLATITTSTTGAFSLNLSIPASARPGNHTVQATGQNSGSSAQATFFVQTNWAMFGFGPERRGVNALENVLTTATVSGLAPDWSYATGNANSLFNASAAVVNSMVYVGSSDHKLYALDAVTGAFKWRYVMKGAIYSTPAVVNVSSMLGPKTAVCTR